MINSNGLFIEFPFNADASSSSFSLLFPALLCNCNTTSFQDRLLLKNIPKPNIISLVFASSEIGVFSLGLVVFLDR